MALPLRKLGRDGPEITRVGLKGVVIEGDSDAVLDRAIGHLPDTPLPWQEGNSALAAHRDTIFRPLEGVRLGDVLRLRTPHGDFDYRVTETLIVKPQDVVETQTGEPVTARRRWNSPTTSS